MTEWASFLNTGCFNLMQIVYSLLFHGWVLHIPKLQASMKNTFMNTALHANNSFQTSGGLGHSIWQTSQCIFSVFRWSITPFIIKKLDELLFKTDYFLKSKWAGLLNCQISWKCKGKKKRKNSFPFLSIILTGITLRPTLNSMAVN